MKLMGYWIVYDAFVCVCVCVCVIAVKWVMNSM